MSVPTLIRPTAQRHPTPVAISIDGARVYAKCDQRIDDFARIAREQKYRWDQRARHWSLLVGPTLGAPEDRAAELAHALLSAQIAVTCPNQSVCGKAINASFEPRYPRWMSLMMRGKMSGKIVVEIDDAGAGALLSRIGLRSYYEQDVYFVSPAHWQVLRDIAERHAVRLTAGAERALQEARAAEESAILVADVPPPPREAINEPNLHHHVDGIHPDLRDEDARPAPRITSVPMAHQAAAVEALAPSRVGALFMEMGTGKSLCAIMLAIRRWHKISNVVWCCPVSLKRNTLRQILGHTDTRPDRAFMFDDKVAAGRVPDADWYIVGLESIGGSSRVARALGDVVNDRTMLIVDESSYIKGHKAARTKRLTLIGQRARYRLVLNGTPISQGIEDLFAQMFFLDERILGYRSWYSFQRQHIRWSERYKGRIESRVGSDELIKRMTPYVFQVTKNQCLDLPPKLPPTARYVSMTAPQRQLYAAAKERFSAEVIASEQDEDAIGVAIYRLFGALRAIASGVVPAGLPGEGTTVDTDKVDELLRVLRQVTDRHVVVWCSYRATVDLLMSIIPSEIGRHAFEYSGGVGERQRDEALMKWRQEGGVFVATEASGGYGLDLIEARHAIFFSNSFKYSERLQAEDRMHRIGQMHPVSYTDIWCECGIETRIEQALRKKGDALSLLQEELRLAGVKRADQLADLIAGHA